MSRADPTIRSDHRWQRPAPGQAESDDSPIGDSDIMACQ
jgi:hypothetical protein